MIFLTGSPERRQGSLSHALRKAFHAMAGLALVWGTVGVLLSQSQLQEKARAINVEVPVRVFRTRRIRPGVHGRGFRGPGECCRSRGPGLLYPKGCGKKQPEEGTRFTQNAMPPVLRKPGPLEAKPDSS